MKIVVKKLPYNKVLQLPPQKLRKPKRPNMFWRTLLKLLSAGVLKKEGFTYTIENMDRAGEGPYLILMNHSSFMDLEIAEHIFYPKPLSIVCTSDGFIGKDWLMRQIGCIPTKKFVSDPGLISNIRYALKTAKSNVLMYPEASYSFDGCATALPRRLGILIKKLDVPVIMIKTNGAFSRQPLYNGLKKRKVDISATVSCIISREDIKERSVDELDAILDEAFTFDNFRWQQQNRVVIDVPDRADGLHRILYKCPHCHSEGQTKGDGVSLYCHACGKQYELDEYGYLKSTDGDTRFDHIPHWYDWQRSEVKKELENGTYRLETDVDILVMVNHKAVYEVGEGTLIHDENGFSLKGCNGELEFTQSPLSSYSLYADYYWYEIGDVICIGDSQRLYYCFPKGDVPVAKARMATEELYKIKRSQRRRKKVLAAE
ncbi:MAG: 1-acyl-sn-glycerol-3-phosphate acyltransferase [Clostridia bacterium]|nr:1-acyl-sn-glycerol-3-phosphate acyltransferase [Clostridia bacterium]